MRCRIDRRAAIVACMALIAGLAVVSGCGSSDSQELTFRLSDQDKEVVLSQPESAESGKAEITLVNDSSGAGDLELIRVDGDHDAEEVLDAYAQAGSGNAIPDWFFAGGGTGVTEPKEENTVTQVLEPGTYYALNTESLIDPKKMKPIVVEGDQSDASLDADTTIAATEYSFEADGLEAGENEILFDNQGKQPHHVVALKMVGDATLDDVKSYYENFGGGGKSPVEESPGAGTAVIEGGESQVSTIDLDQGRYALVCFISDRQGGPPHVAKGMLEEVEVE